MHEVHSDKGQQRQGLARGGAYATPPPWTEMASSLGTLLSQRTTTTETGRAGRCFTNCVLVLPGMCSCSHGAPHENRSTQTSCPPVPKMSPTLGPGAVRVILIR